MAKIEMTWSEVKMRMKQGADIKVLAELNGVSYNAMWVFIKKHQAEENEVKERAKANTEAAKKIKMVEREGEAFPEDKQVPVLVVGERVQTRVRDLIQECEMYLAKLKDEEDGIRLQLDELRKEKERVTQDKCQLEMIYDILEVEA